MAARDLPARRRRLPAPGRAPAGGAGVRRRRNTPISRADAAEEPDAGRRLALLRRALNHLDDESRDLLALHDVGEMPLSALAKLVAHDRKTVRSRLARARRRVSRWLCDDPPSLRSGTARADHAARLTVHARSGGTRPRGRVRGAASSRSCASHPNTAAACSGTSPSPTGAGRSIERGDDRGA